MFYTVYLRYKKTVQSPPVTLPAPVRLDYKDLHVSVKLQKTANPQISVINEKTTNDFYLSSPNGIYWSGYQNLNGNKVIFQPTQSDVSIDFHNETNSSSTSCGYDNGTNGTVITLTYDTPPGVASCGGAYDICAYAQLFTVVVDAYPGELVGLQSDVRFYAPSSMTSGTPCDESTFAVQNSGTNNGTQTVTIAQAPTYSSTPHENLIFVLSDPVPSTTKPGGYDFTVSVKNTSTTNAFTLKYAEFLIEARTYQLSEDFEFSGYTPDVFDIGPAPFPSLDHIKWLHYKITPSNGLLVNPNSLVPLCTITAGPPAISNLGWQTKLKFLDSDSKGRLQTTLPLCTTIQTSGTPVCTITGENFCDDTSIKFKIEGVQNTCLNPKVKVGLISQSPPAYNQITKIEFDITFDMDPGITIDPPDFSNWIVTACPALNNCILPSGNASCWEVSPDGKTFHYCIHMPGQYPISYTLEPERYIEIPFVNTGNGCIKKATVTLLKIEYAGSQSQQIPSCVLPLYPTTGFPICSPELGGTIATEEMYGVEEVSVQVSRTDDDGNSCTEQHCTGFCAPQTTLTNDAGVYGFCNYCTVCTRYYITPVKNDNPLNGVSTFDLVLISKHILGVQPLTSPYKMIAADANISGSVTTFDVLEFRKLILGIYTSLPQNTSWRFIDKSFTFSNPANPFTGPAFHETFSCIPGGNNHYDFVGIKVGDVNGSAIANSKPAERPVLTLGWPRQGAAAGEVVTLPVRYTGQPALEALQLGLQFDPAKLSLIGPSIGEVADWSAGSFGLTEVAKGQIRALWLPLSDPQLRVETGDVLFYLTFKALDTLPDGSFPLSLSDAVLENTAWLADDTECTLAETAVPALAAPGAAASASPEGGLSAVAVPNPTAAGISLTVTSDADRTIRLALFDAFGRRLGMQQVEISKGRQTFELLEVASLPAGVYGWKVIARDTRAQGLFIRQ